MASKNKKEIQEIKVAPTVKYSIGDDEIVFTPSPDTQTYLANTAEFDEWLKTIKDPATAARILQAMTKMRRGVSGVWKELGEGVSELKLDFGPGYRIYYAKIGEFIVVLLGGGDKGTQSKDIANAKKLWKELKIEIKKI